MRKYFKAFSFNKKFIKTQNLIFENKSSTKKLTLQNEQDELCFKQLVEHIEKSLQYTNVRLRKALQKYFVNNYGFLPVSSFRKFLTETGYEDGERQKLAIVKFVQFYEKNYEQLDEGKRCTQFSLARLEDMFPTEEDDNQEGEIGEDRKIVNKVNPARLIMSGQIKNLVLQLKTSSLKLAQFMKHNDLL